MKDKFCVSKTLVYLVLLVAAVVGAFYLTQYTNNQTLTSDSEAAGKGKCVYASTKNYPGGCTGELGGGRTLAQAYGTSFSNDADRNREDKDGKLVSSCCVAEKKPTPTKGGVSCASAGGNWYRTLSYSSCSELGAGYVEGKSLSKNAVTETRSGFLCCVTTRLATPTPGGKTCKQQGGDWYRNLYFPNCSNVGNNFTAVANPTDQNAYKDYKCCASNKLATPTPGGLTCGQQGGNWYSTTKWSSCQELATEVKTPYAGPAQAPSDQAFYPNRLCCVPQRVPTQTP
jgi:hypothetical protein